MPQKEHLYQACYIDRRTLLTAAAHLCTTGCLLAQVAANNLSLVQLCNLEPRLWVPTRWSQDRLLSSLCDSLQLCLTYPLPQDLMLALLLSAVSAGVPTTAPTQTNAAATRNQVDLFAQHMCALLLCSYTCSVSSWAGVIRCDPAGKLVDFEFAPALPTSTCSSVL